MYEVSFSRPCEVVPIYAVPRSFLRYPPVFHIICRSFSRRLFIFRASAWPDSNRKPVVYLAPFEFCEFLRIKGTRNAIREKFRSQIGNWSRSTRDGRLRNKHDRERKRGDDWLKKRREERKKDIRAARISCYLRKQILICDLAIARIDFSKLIFNFLAAHNIYMCIQGVP